MEQNLGEELNYSDKEIKIKEAIENNQKGIKELNIILNELDKQINYMQQKYQEERENILKSISDLKSKIAFNVGVSSFMFMCFGVIMGQIPVGVLLTFLSILGGNLVYKQKTKDLNNEISSLIDPNLKDLEYQRKEKMQELYCYLNTQDKLEKALESEKVAADIYRLSLDESLNELKKSIDYSKPTKEVELGTSRVRKI